MLVEAFACEIRLLSVASLKFDRKNVVRTNGVRTKVRKMLLELLLLGHLQLRNVEQMFEQMLLEQIMFNPMLEQIFFVQILRQITHKVCKQFFI